VAVKLFFFDLILTVRLTRPFRRALLRSQNHRSAATNVEKPALSGLLKAGLNGLPGATRGPDVGGHEWTG